MRVLSWMLPWLVVCTTSTAWGQYGLYGSPEMLRLPQMSGSPAEYGYSISPAQTAGTLPSVSSPMRQPLMQTAALAPANAGPVPSGAYYAGQNPMLVPTPTNPATPAPQGGCVVDQMLQEARPAGPGNCGSVKGPANQFAAAAACGDCTSGTCTACPWYAENNLLWMGRNNGNRVWTTYETDRYPNQLMNTDIDLDWRVGGETRIGRRFCCGTWSAEAVYWGLMEFEGSSSMTNPNTVSTPLATDLVEFEPGELVDYYFNGADIHYLHRESEIHNVELNVARNWFIGGGGCGSGCGPALQLNCLAGLRYFRFTDSLDFWTERDGYAPACIYDQVKNDLWGAQIGVGGSYRFAPKLRLFADGKFGIFGNHMENTYDIYRTGANPMHASPTPASQAVGSYPVDGSGNAVAFMTEAKVGLNWNFWNNWGAQVGYRVVVVNNVSFAENQFLHWVVDFPELETVRHNGDLILHGAFAGITWNF